MKRRDKGQFLVGGIVFAAVLLVVVQSMAWFVRSEQKAVVKHRKATAAFYLAEAGVERGYRAATTSGDELDLLLAGGRLPGYDFDVAYDDLGGGQYAVRITSNPAGLLDIVSVGRDRGGSERRSLKASFAPAALGSVALRARTVAIAGNNFQIDWGAVVADQSIAAGGRVYPQYWSAASIDLDANGATPPNADSPGACQWHSYRTDLPPPPAIDLEFYKSSAVATGTYYAVSQNWNNVTFDTGKTYYIDGNLVLGSPGMYVIGNVIVTGSLILPNGNWGKGDEWPKLPTDAWKQYCRDWDRYRSWDPGAPAAFPGLESDYASLPTITVAADKVAVHGFLYVGGHVSAGGGGGSGKVVGAMFVRGSVVLGSNSEARVLYQSDIAYAVRTTSISLQRTLWREQAAGWPAGL